MTDNPLSAIGTSAYPLPLSISERIAELHRYRPALTRRPDFDEFWSRTLSAAKKAALRPERNSQPFPSEHVKCSEVTFRGFDETPIRAWFLVPSFAKSRIPCVIRHHGYTATYGRPVDHLAWAMMGCAVLVPDHRGQTGVTGDMTGYSHGHNFNVYSKGLPDKDEYYFRRVFVDALKAVDFCLLQPEVDPDRIAVEGGSMGGGISLVVAALDPRISLCLADVASSCHTDKRVWDMSGSFGSVGEYLRHHPDQTDLALETLSYFDAMNHADRIKARVFASVGLKDTVCPPETTFAAYNRIVSAKEMRVYPFNGHEGGGSLHLEAKLESLKKYFF